MIIDLSYSVRMVTLLSVLIYVVFDYFESKHLKDEREELIQLKGLELAHKTTLTVLGMVSLLCVVVPAINSAYIVLALVLSALYTEILGKIYFRRKL